MSLQKSFDHFERIFSPGGTMIVIAKIFNICEYDLLITPFTTMSKISEFIWMKKISLYITWRMMNWMQWMRYIDQWHRNVTKKICYIHYFSCYYLSKLVSILHYFHIRILIEEYDLISILRSMLFFCITDRTSWVDHKSIDIMRILF